MKTLEELNEIPRFCFKCGGVLNYFDFHISASTKHKKIFKLEILEEIWENPIFVLLCCRCYREEYSLMRCVKCGIGIGVFHNIKSLCLDCYRVGVVTRIKNDRLD